MKWFVFGLVLSLPTWDMDRSKMETAPSDFALLLDGLDEFVVHGHRVRAEHQLFGIEAELRHLAERSGVPDAAQAVHDIQHHARPTGSVEASVPMNDSVLVFSKLCDRATLEKLP